MRVFWPCFSTVFSSVWYLYLCVLWLGYAFGLFVWPIFAFFIRFVLFVFFVIYFKLFTLLRLLRIYFLASSSNMNNLI